MKKAIAAWMWSLRVAARSYRAVVILAALVALWVYAAYVWLGLPESSVLLLILALVWALVQLLAAVLIVAGIVSGAADAAASESRCIPIRSLWAISPKKLLSALVYCLIGALVVGLGAEVFAWINGHSIEVASFLSFHSGKPVSHVLLEEIYTVIEGLLWVVISGFLLSFFLALMHAGWRAAGKQTWQLFAGCLFRPPFLTSLLSLAVFGGIAYRLVNWHPRVDVGFWDYSQAIVRLALALLLLCGGALYWALALARQGLPSPDSSDHR